MKFLFLMDPLETVIMPKDTSFILMLGAHNRGHEVYYLPDGGITLENGKISFHVTKVIPQRDAKAPFKKIKDETLSQNDVHAVFVRNDPPFDQRYLMNTWLLDKLPRRIPVINSPLGLRMVNEKLWATQFTSLVPLTLVSLNKEDLLRFIARNKTVVAKPTDGFGGQGVFIIRQGDINTNVILETLTSRFQKEIILQKFVPASTKGDKRILLLNGDPLGAVLRVHSSNDHRNNFFSGGKAKPASVTKNDLKIIDSLKPYLRALGLYFVGIDIIGDYLIEVNVTSPTCLQEMNKFNGAHLERKVIEFAEKLVKTRRL